MSSIPAIYTSLTGILSSALQAVAVSGVPDPIPVQVTLPGLTTQAPVICYVGEIEGTRSAGSQNRIRTTIRNIPFGTSQDEYTVKIFISVSLPGYEIGTVIAIADAVFEGARNAIEAAEDLDVVGVHEALPTGEFRFAPEADANGRYVTVEFGVDVTARD